MNRKPGWWQLYLFTAIALVFLLRIPPTDKSGLILWMLVVYGVMAIWLKNNQSGIAAQSHKVTKTLLPAVEEFSDEDRLLLQQRKDRLIDEYIIENQTEET